MIVPIAMSVCRKDESPIFGETATHVIVEDEAAGPYILLRQYRDDNKPSEVRLDIEQLEEVLTAARKLIKVHPRL